MSHYQICPKCLGQGVTGYPPNVPAGMDVSSTQTSWQCDICRGQKIILAPGPDIRDLRGYDPMRNPPFGLSWDATPARRKGGEHHRRQGAAIRAVIDARAALKQGD